MTQTGRSGQREQRPRVALFDYEVTEGSPAGSCHLRLVEGLRDEIDFTVFATAFDNPDPQRIRWVRVPSLRRPLAARFVSYYLASTIQQRHGYDLVQGIENYAPRCDVRYVHFCHRSYLRHHWAETRATGPRGWARRLDHQLRASTEGQSLRAARLLVVPSPQLGDELEAEHGVGANRIRVIPNPVVLGRFQPSDPDARRRIRTELGVADSDLLVAFVALGHFERKGLPALLAALEQLPQTVKLLVVGGQPDLVARYTAAAAAAGLANRAHFVGMREDVRPYLYAADAFAAPSSYEVFSLAPLQAAAAGLPLLVTTLPGVAPFFRDQVHGFTVTRDPADIAAAVRKLLEMDPARRRKFGLEARNAVQVFDVPHFLSAWRDVYQELLPSARLA